MKKKFNYLIFTVVLSLAFVFTVSAASFSVSANKSSVVVGNTVKVTVKVSGAAGWEYCVNYDSSLFTLTSAGSDTGGKCVKTGSTMTGYSNITYTFKARQSGSGTFSETITMGADRTEGSSTTVNMYTTSNSVHPLINMYLNINTLTANLAVDGFIWEVCAERSGETPVCNSGNFQGYNSTNNNEVLILSNYRLTNVNTAFTVYLWIDGSKITGDLTDAQFSGYIDARSENFKAKFGQ